MRQIYSNIGEETKKAAILILLAAYGVLFCGYLPSKRVASRGLSVVM